MKQLKSIFLLVCIFILSTNVAYSQVEEGFIKYRVDLFDEFSGGPVDDRLGKIDWEFEIAFSKNKSRVYEQYTTEKNTIYIHNKESEIVLSLYQEFGKKFISYSNSKGNSVKQLGHNYGDTVFIEHEETKNILGYHCRKIELDLGGQVKGTFWVTDEINIGTIVPGSPLALKHPALEYTFEGAGMKKHFLAIEIETTVSDYSIFNEMIPSDYKLIVPIDVYDQEEFIEDSTKIEHSEFDFISYPKYPDGLASLYDLFNGLPAYPAQKNDFMEGENGETIYFGPNSILASFTVDRNGNLSDMRVQLAPNEEIEHMVIEILKEMPNWTPATVKNVPIQADMNLSIKIPIAKQKE